MPREERPTLPCKPPKGLAPHQELRQELGRLRREVRRLERLVAKQESVIRKQKAAEEEQDADEWLRSSFTFS